MTGLLCCSIRFRKPEVGKDAHVVAATRAEYCGAGARDGLDLHSHQILNAAALQGKEINIVTFIVEFTFILCQLLVSSTQNCQVRA